MLIHDEITIGWRFTFGGSHQVIGVTPDIAVFAKALGNGHPIGAIIGKRSVMEAAQSSFISSTYWTEAVGPTAALATINKMEKTRVWEHAAWLLRTTNQQAGQIAGAVGYASETAFYQAFRNHFHVTPQQYRKRSAAR